MARTRIALALVALSCAAAQAQPCGADFGGARTVEAGDFSLLFRTRPAKIAVGRHFAVEMLVCPSAAVPGTIAVDAFMPEHRHGMNYKPVVKALGGGRFEADGLMFHMPGRWEFRFAVERQGRTEHLTSPFVLR
jgi:hypothetical protein